MPQTSLRKLEEVVRSMEAEYGGEVAAADRLRQQATLQFLAGLRELIAAFCLQGCADDEECVYIPYTLRDE